MNFVEIIYNKGGIYIKKKERALISLVSLGIFIGAVGINKSIEAINTEDKAEEAKIAKGIEIIKELEKKDVIKSEQKIEQVQSNLSSDENRKDKEDGTLKIDYIEKFSSSLIMGDSRAEGFTSYGILDNSSVIAYKGRNLITAVRDGDLARAESLSPQNIFLTYGMNDIRIYSNGKDFVKEYEKLIKDIQQKLPNTNIYVNSIFRVKSFAVNKNPEFKRIDEFNIELQKMCKNLGVTYIDGSSIVRDDLFEPDGVHFKPQFDKNWLNLLINRAKL